MTDEIWLPVIGYENLYEVSSFGNIRNMKGKLLKVHKRGRYYSKSLSNNNVAKSYRVHRLVALSFIPNPDDKPYINHIDNNPFNNHADNLEWVSQKENIQHAINQQRMSKPPIIYVAPEKIQKAKELLDQGVTRREVQSIVGICAFTICTYFGRKIKRGKWKES